MASRADPGGLSLGRDRRHRAGLGVLLGLLVTVPQGLGVMLAVFAGFFLFVGAAELLPEAHRSDRSRWVVVATLGGVVAIYIFSIWAGAIE
jgi:zinc transporter ZupT